MSKKRGPIWQPSPDESWELLREQNPWNQTGEVPSELAKPVERSLARLLSHGLRRSSPRRFQVILGPRRVGKTTSMYQTVKHLLEAGVPSGKLWWLRLDHPLLMQANLGDLTKLVIKVSRATSSDPTYLFFDELTYATHWDLWLKTFYDEMWPVKIAATSSSTAALRNRMLESGVGRWEEQYLSPYLFPEFLSLVGRPVSIPVASNLSETLASCIDARVDVSGLAGLRRSFLLTGGFPELLIERKTIDLEDDASLLLQSQRILKTDAVDRAIYMDIPQAFQVSNPRLLERMLYSLAGQITGVLSPANICQDLGGMSQPTFDRYLTYLERAFLVFTLSNYSGNESSIQKRGRKLYFVDAAVRNAALQRGLRPLSDPAEMGLLLENMVAGHLKALGEVTQVRVFYWRDKQDEIDLIYDHPDAPVAFEVSHSGRHHRQGIHAFEARCPRFAGRCYLVAPDVPATRPGENLDGVGTIPTDLFLIAVGSQMSHELAIRLAP